MTLFLPGSEAASIVVTLLCEMSMKVAGEAKDSWPCWTVVILFQLKSTDFISGKEVVRPDGITVNVLFLRMRVSTGRVGGMLSTIFCAWLSFRVSELQSIVIPVRLPTVWEQEQPGVTLTMAGHWHTDGVRLFIGVPSWHAPEKYFWLLGFTMIHSWLPHEVALQSTLKPENKIRELKH